MSGKEAKDFYGKVGTYHWDENIDLTGRVSGHGPNDEYGSQPHLQIHDENGNVIRIFYD